MPVLRHSAIVTIALGMSALGTPVWAAAAAEALDRTILPIREPEYPPITEIDARRAKPPPRFEVTRREARRTW
jgi:arylsulfatase